MDRDGIVHYVFFEERMVLTCCEQRGRWHGRSDLIDVLKEATCLGCLANEELMDR